VSDQAVILNLTDLLIIVVWPFSLIDLSRCRMSTLDFNLHFYLHFASLNTPFWYIISLLFSLIILIYEAFLYLIGRLFQDDDPILVLHKMY